MRCCGPAPATDPAACGQGRSPSAFAHPYRPSPVATGQVGGPWLHPPRCYKYWRRRGEYPRSRWLSARQAARQQASKAKSPKPSRAGRPTWEETLSFMRGNFSSAGVSEAPLADALEACQRARQWAVAAALLAAVAEFGFEAVLPASIARVRHRPRLHLAAATAQRDAQDWKAAVQTLRAAAHAEEPPEETRGEAAQQEDSGDSQDRSSPKAAEQPGCRILSEICQKALAACSKKRQWEATFALVGTASRQRLQLDFISHCVALSSLSHRLGRSWVRSIHRLRHLVNQGKMTAVAGFNTVVTDCTRSSNWGVSILLLKEAIRRKLEPTDVTIGAATAIATAGAPQAVTTELIAALSNDVARADSPEEASKPAAERQQSAPAQPGTRTMRPPELFVAGARLADLRRRGKWQDISGLLVNVQSSRLELDVVTWNAAATAYSEASQWEDSFACLASLTHRSLDADHTSFRVAATAARSAASQLRHWQLSTGLLRHAQRQTVETDLILHNSALRAAFLAIQMPDLSQEDQAAALWPQAMLQLEDMSRQSIRPNQFSVRMLSRSCGAIPEAWQTSVLLHAKVYRFHWPLPGASTDGTLTRVGQTDVQDEDAFVLALGFGSCWQEALFSVSDKVRKGWAPQAVPYFAALQICEGCLLWKHQLSLLTEMQMDGLDVDISSWAAYALNDIGVALADDSRVH
eukprot:TRINITY_DN65570_c0_g1_i2.p1 TRINITY_DN65570_c0_g1~~TRINITY_DN65570_c0_g1_i2.p1  ORF type:complete len:693 (+),score=109.03 TRINITY_DN65570_c0_g1_i2:169-2247(+)